MKIEHLEPNRYYHIYNRGINGTDIFIENDNYLHFLKLYQKYVDPIADTYAWCLMKNHFHFLVYLKEMDEINLEHFSYSTVKEPKQINLSRQFGHLFNAYCLSFNKRFQRTGSLFEKPFERKLVDNDKYFTRLIFYIHNNPVNHSFTNKINDYAWSSYRSIISNKPTRLKRKQVIDLFETLENFIYFHKIQHNFDDMDNLLID